jgi:hypothetical protein
MFFRYGATIFKKYGFSDTKKRLQICGSRRVPQCMIIQPAILRGKLFSPQEMSCRFLQEKHKNPCIIGHSHLVNER